LALPTDANAVRIGILSTARIARDAIIPAIRKSHNAAVVAVASRDADRARIVAEQAGAPRAYGGYEQLLKDPEVEAVYNPLPNAMHRPWSVAAAEAGKHVLCEKPLAGNAAAGQAVVDACKRHGVKLMEAFMYRFSPRNIAALAAIEDHAIGRVRYIRSAICFPVSDQANIRLSKPLEGGSLRDMGCYCVNLARWVTGEEPTSVFADAYFGGRSGVDEVMHATLRFPWGVVSQHVTSFHVHMPPDAEIVGTEGRIVIPGFLFNVPHFDLIHDGEAHRIETAPTDSYQLMIEYFADAVRSGRPIERCSGEDAVANLRVIDALYESARAGRVVDLGATL